MHYRNDETYARPWTLSMLAMVLGALFLVAGVAKLAEFPPFLQTVASITGLPPASAGAAGTALVLAEISAGLALICRYRVTIAALMLCGMTLLFISILLTSILTEAPIDCHCFGLLGSLPVHVELLLDLALLDLLLLLALLNRQRRWPAFGLAGVLCGSVLLAGLEFTTVRVAFGHVQNTTDATVAIPLASADALLPEFRDCRTGNRALLFLRFTDFSCPLCFDDFILLSDSLAARPLPLRQRTAALIRIDSTALFRSPMRLEQWVRQSGIVYPVVAVADSLFAAAGIQKSLVTVVDPDGKILLSGEFPLGPEKRDNVLRLLSQLSPE